MLKINLGSGQRPFDGDWVNVDCNSKWAPDVVAEASSMPMFTSGSADIIVAHQMIEHVGLGEFNGVIQEANRILRPGGSFILTTPDLKELVKAWVMGKIDDYIFCVNLYGAYMDDEADRHRWLYHTGTLTKALLSAAAWSSVRPFEWRELDGADIAKDWWVLGMEAVK